MEQAAHEVNLKEQVDKRLELYVKQFVKTFEAELEKRKSQQAVGSEPEVSRTGKTVKEVSGVVAGGLGAVVPLPGASAASKIAVGKVTDFLFKKTIGKQSREKAKTLHEFFRHVKADDLRTMVVQAAGEIFRCFEYQFTNVTDIGPTGGGWARALDKLAKDAIGRIMNYTNEHNEEECSVKLLTKCVILGESKTGHTVSFREQKVKTNVLYEIKRIIVPLGECSQYYAMSSTSNDYKTLGYRLSFSWEELKDYNKKLKKPKEVYNYVLDNDHLKEQLDRILRALDRKDKEKTSEKVHDMHEKFNDIELDTKDIRQKTTEIHDKIIRGGYERKLECSFCFDVRAPIASFTGRTKELEALHKTLQSKGPTVISQIVTVSGLGGIGKTELARKYISVYSQEYDDRIVWINAENRDSLNDSFKRLYCSKFGMRKVDVQEIDIKDIPARVYREFADKKCLFVFDNAERRQDNNEKDAGHGIDAFLPSAFPLYTKKTYVLITSRNGNWGKIGVLGLDVFNKEEAIEFIQQELKMQQYFNKALVQILIEELQYYPLALHQALAYISTQSDIRTNIGLSYNIKDYLIEFRKNAKNLLNHELSKDTDNIYTKTVYTTWSITFSQIESDVECGKIAKHILETISFLAPNNIPVQMFIEHQSADDEKHKLGCAIKLLKQYSLIQEGQNETLINVHRLVQKVTRLTLQETQRYNDAIDKCYNYFMNIMSKDLKNAEKSILLTLFNHVQMFVFRLNEPEIRKSNKIKHNNLESNPSTFAITSDRVDSTIMDLKDCIQSKELLKRSIKLLVQDKRLWPECPEVLTALHNLVIATEDSGNHANEKELLERVLNIQIKHHGPVRPEVAIILHNLAKAVGKLGDCTKLKKLLEQALNAQEILHGPDNPKIVQTLLNLVIAIGNFGDYATKTELLERVKNIKKKHHSPNNPKVVLTKLLLIIIYCGVFLYPAF